MTSCEQCGQPVDENDDPAGASYMRCSTCDPEGEHIATTFPRPGGPCATCRTEPVDAADNPGCRTAVDLAAVRAYLHPRITAATSATSPAEALRALTALEAACRKARERVAVHVVLDDGWTYAQLGRAYGVTRQAALKQYASAVAEQLRRHVHGRRPETS